MFKPQTENKNRVYHRQEESHYVYRLHPDGKGATVASTVQGDYNFHKAKEGVETKRNTGTIAGIFAGELDEHGRLTQGGYQKWVKEGDAERMEIRGTVDPTMFAEKVGVSKPSALKDKPFDKTKAVAEHLPLDFDELVDQLVTREEFTQDPFLIREEPTMFKAQKAIHGSASLPSAA